MLVVLRVKRKFPPVLRGEFVFNLYRLFLKLLGLWAPVTFLNICPGCPRPNDVQSGGCSSAAAIFILPQVLMLRQLLLPIPQPFGLLVKDCRTELAGVGAKNIKISSFKIIPPTHLRFVSIALSFALYNAMHNHC